MSEAGVHRRELQRLGAFGLSLLGLALLTYVLPPAEAARPWLPGEPLPLVRLLDDDQAVTENQQGDLVVEDLSAADAVALAPADGPEDLGPVEAAGGGEGAAGGGSPVPARPTLPARPPARGAYLVVPEGALDHWFSELARAEAGEPGVVVRALHWGDSTIAGDGITRTVRERLQARFGDGGPGFLSVQVDPRWAHRPTITRSAKGDWETLTIIFGGAETARYGLGGTVSTAEGEATSYLANTKVEGVRAPNHRFEVWYQRQPGGGSFTMKPRGAPGTGRSTASEHVGDAWAELDVPQGAESLWIATKGDGPVSLYGAVLETAGPGVTWETFGVAGAGQGSMMRQGRRHLAGQIARRDPALLVYMTGGNELSYPSLEGEGTKYRESFVRVLERLRAGAPEASCLVITPLDQATRERGEIKSKENLEKMVRLQREAAEEQGCAFWDAWRAMGGEGAFARWLAHDPPLAWTDLMHLSDEGLEIVGHSFADAVELAYDGWRAERPELPAPGSLAPAPEAGAAPAPVAEGAPAGGPVAPPQTPEAP